MNNSDVDAFLEHVGKKGMAWERHIPKSFHRIDRMAAATATKKLKLNRKKIKPFKFKTGNVPVGLIISKSALKLGNVSAKRILDKKGGDVL